MEIDLDRLLSKKVGRMKYKEISKFPEIKKDIAIVIDENITAKEVSENIKKAGGGILDRSEVFDVYKGKGIPNGKKSIAFSLTFLSSSKTLTDEEVNAAVDKIVERLNKELKAELR